LPLISKPFYSQMLRPTTSEAAVACFQLVAHGGRMVVARLMSISVALGLVKRGFGCFVVGKPPPSYVVGMRNGLRQLINMRQGEQYGSDQ